jgi:TolB-like protein/Tfp pilus assembly protein PilF
MVLPRFLAELKHRNVYRAAVVYAAVGWALLEAADVVLPRLGLPDWTVNLVLALVLLGFPLAIVFAWIFDVSAQGIVRTEPISPYARHRFSFVSIAEFVLICFLVVIVGYLYVERLSLQKKLVEPEIAVQEAPAIPNPEQYRAIAVLPFADMSEAGDQAWFAEGIAEELLHALAGVEGLKVMARTSSFAFKGTDKTIAEIAEILGVQAVLEGSVRRSGELIRITAQLVDASSGYHIWSGSYQRELTDIFRLQDELALSVVKALRLKLGVEQRERLVAEQTVSMEAYNWFIRGRALYDWANWKTLKQSIQYFQQAVEADPQYAMAWGYLANALSLSVVWQSADEAFPAAQSAYQRALALDQEQSQALSAKALRLALYDHDWGGAVELYQRAMRSRDDAFVKIGYGAFITHAADRPDVSVRMYREAEKRDPLHAGIKANLGTFLLYVGDTEVSIEKAKEALELEPEHIFAFIALMDAYTAKGQYEEVKETIERIPPNLLQSPSILARVGLYYAAMGEQEKAVEIYRRMVEHPSPAPVVTVSDLALALGHKEEALDYMELLVEKRSWTIPWIRTLYRYNAKVKDHPRYLALLKRIGLDDESVKLLNSRITLD